MRAMPPYQSPFTTNIGFSLATSLANPFFTTDDIALA